jgi:hypothetical protein
MDGNNERFQSYLREFEPRRPRTLPEASAPALLEWRRLAAAAALIVTVSGSVWFVARRAAPDQFNVRPARTFGPETKLASRDLSVWRLNQIALSNSAGLDAELTEKSREVLPNFQGAASTLRVLAKE